MHSSSTVSFAIGAKPLALGLVLLAGGVWCVHRMAKTRANGPDSKDADASDPALLRDHSEIKPYRADRPGITYPGIRVFYRRHPKADELPKDPAPLPLLVCIHGLGGSVAQFHPLLTSLTNSASCLAIDLPGCGRSQFSPTSWEAYTTEALTDLVETIIDDYREKDQGVVLIAHSMGTAIAARIANKKSAHHEWPPSHVMGLVAICPVAGPPSEAAVRNFRKLLWIPDMIFDLWRAWDRWGGPESASVKRFVGPGADLESRQLQDKFNSQSRTPVFRRMAWGSLPVYSKGKPTGGLFGEPTWAGLQIPVYLLGGKHDTVTPPTDIEKIEMMIQSEGSIKASAGDASNTAALPSHHDNINWGAEETISTRTEGSAIADAAAPVNTTANPREHMPQSIEAISDEDFVRKQQRSVKADESFEDPSTPREHDTPGGHPYIPPQPIQPPKAIKSGLLPAGHALLFMPTVARTLAGLVGDFMNDHITGRFSLGWQLQYLSREGKWDVKNLEKWKKVQQVSGPIGGIFRAMKTLREADEEHSPRVFAANWGKIIKDIIDISHDDPKYDPRSFGNGIKYHKFGTVSKIPPTDAEVSSFIQLVDKIREDQKARASTEPGWGDEYFIGVHCHYGFNRTGYFLVCYLIERCGFGVQQALDTFAKARPNGIRHTHFIDRLFVRYSGLEQ